MKHTRETLKAKIAVIEARHEIEKKEFNQQLKVTFASLKLSNLIKSTFRELTQTTLDMKGNIAEAVLPLLTNYFSGRLASKTDKNSFSRVLATLAQIAVTNYTARHSHTIMTFVSGWLDNFSDFLSRSASKMRKHAEPEPDSDEPEAED